MIEGAIRNELINQSEIRSLIGDRFAWGQMPAGTTTPYLVAKAIPDRGIQTLSGEASIKRLRVIFEAVATEYAKAKEILQAIEKTIVGPRSSIGGEWSNGCEKVRESDVPSAPISGQGQARFRRQLELVVWHRE